MMKIVHFIAINIHKFRINSIITKPILQITGIALLYICISLQTFSQVLINELYIKPDDGSPSKDGLIYGGTKEYLELYNEGCLPVNVAGYYIVLKQEISGTFIGGTIRIPNVAAATIPAGSHIVIGAVGYDAGGASVSGAFDLLVGPGNACEYPPSGTLTPRLTLPNSEGWVALFDPSGEPLD
ncbi:MAG: lamin tail domain-containing protein, partial [Bacteroidota bacterium]